MTEWWNIVETQKTTWMVEYCGKLAEWWGIFSVEWNQVERTHLSETYLSETHLSETD